MRVFRKLLPTELRGFRDHLLRLSPPDRASRFSGGLSDAAVALYAQRFEWLTGILIGCFIDGVLRGVAELRGLMPAVGWRAEIAVTVEEAWQGEHIGTELLRRAIDHARNRGLTSLTMLCLNDNRRMLAITRKFDGDLVFDGSQVDATIALPFPTHLTLLEETMTDSMAFVASWWDQVSRGPGGPGPGLPRPGRSRGRDFGWRCKPAGSLLYCIPVSP